MVNMEYFCGDKEEYIKYLGQDRSWHEQYIDPDTTYGNNASSFYKKLTDFLMTKKLDDNWEYSFCSEYIENNERPVGICVNDSISSKPILYLRSDQFGFSAPQKNRAWNEKNPYVAYLNLGGEKEFVAECIWDMRTLGGCFLWPLVCTGNRWQSMYNIYRGVKSYIEDRVDLTLYEIKSFYKLIEKYPDESNQVISELLSKEGYLLLKYKDNEKICEWLRHFKNFEGYVEHFCFRPFVDDRYRVIDITKSKLEDDENVNYDFTIGCPILSKELVDDYRMSKQERIEAIKDKDKIKQILINVRNMTVRRTKYMETILQKN